jgi:hypothetical protein
MIWRALSPLLSTPDVGRTRNRTGNIESYLAVHELESAVRVRVRVRIGLSIHKQRDINL